MMAGTGDLVERLFARLLIAIDGDNGPVTIGDLYQRLIPYRSVRSEIGVMELASYEHAFLRLLSGEGGHLQVGSEAAAAEIGRELDSPNPILGIYRDYPDVPVRISAAPDDSRSMSPEVAPQRAPEADSQAPSPGGALPLPLHSTEEAAAPLPGGGIAPAGADTTLPFDGHAASRLGATVAPPSDSCGPAAICDGCASPLPSIDGIRFCPFCGRIRDPFPCDRCGASIQAEWSYCIRCGASATP